MIVTAAIAWAVIVSGVCIYVAVACDRAAREARRASAWANRWRTDAERLAAMATASRARRASAGRKGREAQIERERARIAATTARLQAGQ